MDGTGRSRQRWPRCDGKRRTFSGRQPAAAPAVSLRRACERGIRQDRGGHSIVSKTAAARAAGPGGSPFSSGPAAAQGGRSGGETARVAGAGGSAPLPRSASVAPGNQRRIATCERERGWSGSGEQAVRTLRLLLLLFPLLEGGLFAPCSRGGWGGSGRRLADT